MRRLDAGNVANVRLKNLIPEPQSGYPSFYSDPYFWTKALHTCSHGGIPSGTPPAAHLQVGTMPDVRFPLMFRGAAAIEGRYTLPKLHWDDGEGTGHKNAQPGDKVRHGRYQPTNATNPADPNDPHRSHRSHRPHNAPPPKGSQFGRDEGDLRSEA